MLQPLPSELPDAFTFAEARALGVTRRRLDSEDLSRPFRGGRVMITSGDADQTEPDIWDRMRREHVGRMRAYAPLLPPDGYFCGPSAAIAWRIPMPPWVWQKDALHVGVHRPRRAPRRPGIIGHQHTRGFVKVGETDGLPVTDAASTWATLGGILGLDALVAAADHVLRVPRHPGGFAPVTETALATREELEILTRRRGRPGAPRLRQALELARTGAASAPETQIRLIIRGAGMPEPMLDYDVYDDHGRFLGCSELAYPELKLAIEYESDGHLTRKQLQRDIDKYQSYTEAGWYPVRLTSEHVYRHPSETVRRVRRARAMASRHGFRPDFPSIWH
ncbi:hypothetical protein ACFPJ2_00520 [Microbacterium suwonense]|uniref:hypothetical protein n=1 Tax=Microbacterium suwonense TaxID=683047 RepID=UPI00360B9D81